MYRYSAAGAGPGASGRAAGPPASPVPHLTWKFFERLRGFVLAACDRLGVGDPADVPVRVAVPAFATRAHPGTQVLELALRKAGWALHPDRGLLSEPYANAIGVLTRGANVLQPTGRLHLADMFH